MVKVKAKVYEKINTPPTVIGVIVIGLRKESISQAARLERYLMVL